jgi:hypothetical protein
MALSAPVSGQEMPLPVDVQLAMFDRILTYDKAFDERVGPEVVVGVLYQQNYRASRDAKDALLVAARERATPTLSGVPVRFVPVLLNDERSLVGVIEAVGIDVLYVTPVRAVDVADLARVNGTRHVTTITGVPAYVESGIAVGLDLRGGKPEIVVNVETCEQSGVVFSSQLLQLARRIE